MVKGDGDSPQYNAKKCTERGQFCQAWKWATPAGSQDVAECGTDAYPVAYPPVFTPVAGKGVDGDYCEAVEDCYTSAENVATCTDNVCKASTKDQGACKVEKDCPVDYQCTGKKCTALKKSGETCANSGDCGFKTLCVKKDGEDLKCTEYNSLANGALFTLPAQLHENLGNEPTASNVCSSGYQFTVGNNLECRDPNRSKVQGLKGRSTDEIGQTCAYITFNDTTDYKKEVNATSTSYCGFNKDNKAYCQMQPGDDEFVAIRKKYMEKTKDFKCHRLSGGEDGSICADVFKFMSDKIAFDFYKLTASVSDGQTAANVANNDECAAATVMSNFWQGRSPDSALTYGAFGVCASLIAFVLF